jgi:carbon storage regulator
MLLVRRRAGESIRIGEEIEIQITEITPTRVTLGILAPREVPVVRSEVRLTRDQNRAAAGPASLESLAKLAGALRLR